jgi:hypothetical protein
LVSGVKIMENENTDGQYKAIVENYWEDGAQVAG